MDMKLINQLDHDKINRTLVPECKKSMDSCGKIFAPFVQLLSFCDKQIYDMLLLKFDS